MTTMNAMIPADSDTLTTAFTVAIDDREKLPYAFSGIRADACDGRRPLAVQTVRAHLPTGDYSIVGHEVDGIAVERKSLEDLFGTLGQNRERFERELERLSAYRVAAVICEATWETMLGDPPPFSQLLPKTVHRSVIAWMQRYPTVQWIPMGDRRLAEITTFRVLERYWKSCGRPAAGAGVEL